jgi:hypothetical protein
MQNSERRRNEYLLSASCYRSDFRPGASLHEEEALKNSERRHQMKPKKETEIELDPKTAALLELIAAGLGVPPDEVARESLQKWLNAHFQKN